MYTKHIFHVFKKKTYKFKSILLKTNVLYIFPFSAIYRTFFVTIIFVIFHIFKCFKNFTFKNGQ